MKLAESIRAPVGWGVFHALRAAEPLCGPAGLRALAWPVASALALADARHRPLASPFQSCVPGASMFPGWTVPSFARWLVARRRFHLTRVLMALPDRLTLPRWRGRCRIEGEGFLKAALQSRRPVILAALHFGGLLPQRYWLRAMGHPVATLVKERLLDRSNLKIQKDALSGPADVPNVFSGQFPREATQFLKAGGVLTVMLDHATGRLLEAEVPGGGWRISPTALRLAALTGATVLPVLVREEGPWRFVIHVGRPVPEDFLNEPEDFTAAARHLWEEFLSVLKLAPDDCMPELLGGMMPVSAVQSTDQPCHTIA